EEREKAALLDLQIESIKCSNAPEVLDQAFGIDRTTVHHLAQVTRTKPPTQNLNRNNQTRIVAPSFHSTYSRRLARRVDNWRQQTFRLDIEKVVRYFSAHRRPLSTRPWLFSGDAV